MMVADAVVSKYPTYEETVAGWPELTDGEGRVVLYFPRQGLKSVNPIGVGGSVSVPVTVDDQHKTSVGDRTFVFFDLPEGSHVFAFKLGRFSPSQEVQLDVEPGQVKYVEVDVNYMKKAPPRIVDATEAVLALESLHHNYKQALPVNRQKKRAMRAI